MGCGWEKVKLGGTGLLVNPLGLSASYGASGADVEYAFERGINYFYWGSMRTADFGRGLKTVAAKNRDKIAIVVQTYTRVGALMRGSLDGALKKLNTDYADLLLLGWWNDLPPRRIIDAALALKEAGKARHILVSCHNRPSFQKFIEDPAFDAVMVRYNAAHPGAEKEVFPFLEKRRVGVVSYTATRWGHLVRPDYTPEGEKTPRASDCYRFDLSNPNVDVCLIGPKDRAQLDEAMAALDRGPMDSDELAWMKRVGQAVRGRNTNFIQRMMD